MTKMAAKRVTWIAVLDGAKSLLFENKGFDDAPDLHLLDKDTFTDAPDRAIKTDAPGTAHSSVGQGRSYMEETDFHQQNEDRFVAHFADTLNRAALAGKFDRLALMAPPKAMGELRSHLHEETARRIVREVTGDYTNHPTPKLEAVLKKELAPAQPQLAE